MAFKQKNILLISVAAATSLITIYATHDQASQSAPDIPGSITSNGADGVRHLPNPNSVDQAALTLGADARNFAQPDVPLHPDGNYYHLRGSYTLDAQHNAVIKNHGAQIVIRISPNTRIFRPAAADSVAINAVGRYFEDINATDSPDAILAKDQAAALQHQRIRLIDAEFVEFSERPD
ncbi:MAG: hypothetical protein V4443_08345 [Pseudomonadota bacterium]